MEVENQGTPPEEAGQFESDNTLEGQPPVNDEGTLDNPNENPNDPVGDEGQPPAPNYYTPEEMRTLQVDGIDTSRIPPEMQALYQAMQAPITRKSMELSEKLNTLGQGQVPPQETQQAPQQMPAPSLDDIATQNTLQKMGLQAEPEPWEEGYKSYMLELADTRRDLKHNVARRQTAIQELNDFRAGFTPEQFAQIDSEAETKMYKLLSDPATKAEGQRIQHAIQVGDTQTVLAFSREVAKEVLSRNSQQTPKGNTPPVTETPSGHQIEAGHKDPSKMSMDEYKAYRASMS